MALNLNDLMQKAKNKGFRKDNLNSDQAPNIRPWQEESVLFTNENHGYPESDEETTGEQQENSPAKHGKVSLKKERENLSDQNKLTKTIPSNKQSPIKPGNNQGITREQLGNISENNQTTIREQVGNNQKTTRIQSENELGNNRDNRELKTILSSLIGLQKNIFYYVLEKCLQNAESDTGALLTRDMANTVNCSYESTKVILSRLIKKGLVCRLKGKGCKGGYIKLSIPNQIQVIALEIKNVSGQIYSSSEVKPGNKLDNKPENNFLYSSSNINTTTVIEIEWKSLDIEPLGKIGFSETQLMQLQSKNTPEIVQESIYHFAYGLEHNSKFKNYSDPLNVLMGVLRKGGGWFEKDYKSPQEIAMQQFIEHKKIQQEREQAVKEELVKLEFEEWLSKLPNEDKNKISSNFIIPAELKNSRQVVIRAKFFEYFKENIINGMITETLK